MNHASAYNLMGKMEGGESMKKVKKAAKKKVVKKAKKGGKKR
ncbi:MAG: hypothetical protein UV57_C0019G0016 [Parcubacteria group bacterium GW2011_GWD2_43_10]|nr:MAG: hypothetical protein UV57_C0019G0016 [Parcubacteria group bacterium GW2011_GWD2_43_10]